MTCATECGVRAPSNARSSFLRSACARGGAHTARGTEHERSVAICPQISVIDVDRDAASGARVSAPVDHEIIASFFHFVPAPAVQRRAMDTLPGLGPALTPAPPSFIKDPAAIRFGSFQGRPAPARTANSGANGGQSRVKPVLLIATVALAAFGVSFGALLGVSRGTELTTPPSALSALDTSQADRQVPPPSTLLVAAQRSEEWSTEPHRPEPKSPPTTANGQRVRPLSRGSARTEVTVAVVHAASLWRPQRTAASDNPY